MMMPGAGVQLLLLDLAYHAWPYLNAYYRACAVKVACDYEFATGISPVSSASKDYLGVSVLLLRGSSIDLSISTVSYGRLSRARTEAPSGCPADPSPEPGRKLDFYSSSPP